MSGKFVGIGIMTVALIVGVTMYYLQLYATYEVIEPDTVTLQLTSIVSGEPEAILADDFEGIDSFTSPIRFRGCFTTPMSLALLSETYVAYDAAEPLTGPGWFSCYDAETIGADLESGEALPFLSEAEIADGVDRVIAIYDDGRAFVWHQLNEKYRE